MSLTCTGCDGPYKCDDCKKRLRTVPKARTPEQAKFIADALAGQDDLSEVVKHIRKRADDCENRAGRDDGTLPPTWRDVASTLRLVASELSAGWVDCPECGAEPAARCDCA